MSQYLRERLPCVRVVQGDFMKTEPEDIPGHPFQSVASNLPYSISTPALLRVVRTRLRQRIQGGLMLQWEVR
jgi:16S rRNA A1518/A1519 N6-dimethyltransferase RsmA/KsgA/DIM1 with predicted DNA glycosylase/AP lyase activity